MVNWKAANVASGVFSVLTFIITAILFVMYLTKQADVQAAAASVASRVGNAAQNFASTYGPAQPAQQFEYPQNAQSTGSPQPLAIDPYTGQPIQGGAEISNGTIAALALLGISLVFHGIIWGLTFGQAKNGYDDD